MCMLYKVRMLYSLHNEMSINITIKLGFPVGTVVWNPPTNARDVGSIPGLRRSPGEGNGHPLQYSCLENSMDRGAWRAAESQMKLSMHHKAGRKTRKTNQYKYEKKLSTFSNKEL